MANIHKAEQVAANKKETVKKIADLIKKYPIIGSLNMENLPAAQLQKMKAQLRDKVEMFMTKRRLMKLAIEKVKGEKAGIEKIEEHLKGMPALLFTNENPFALFRTLKKRKTKAPAKAGQIAPSDIVVKAGPTSFAPGPVIGELGALGIKTKVEAGKIAIVNDAVVCKEGQTISANLAGMLTRLGIQPMEIGLNLVAVYEGGNIFTKSVLDIDEDKFMADLTNAARWAFNLSCEAAYLTESNKEMLVQKAFRDAKVLALSQNILADAVVEELLAKAEREMLSLKSSLPEMPEPKAEEKKEEVKAEKPKVEEKKEEVKPEEPKAEEKHAEKPKAGKKAHEPEPVKEIEQKKEEKQLPEKVEKKEQAPKAEVKKEQTGKKEDMEKVEELAQKLLKKGDLRDVKVEKEKAKKKKKEDSEKSEAEKVEDLTAELMRKGTLRK